jgi:outer membrane protein OmpA-like peptidoglycan-associated protein
MQLEILENTSCLQISNIIMLASFKPVITSLLVISINLITHLTIGQRGTLQFSSFGGQSRYMIDKNTSTSDYLFNHVGFGYGIYLTDRISIIGSNEIGSLFDNKLVLAPSIGSLSSKYFSGSLGFQIPVIQIQKSSLLINLGTTYQSIENSCGCTTGERYRREYANYLGAQWVRNIHANWSIFLGGQLSKPISTTLNDPDLYMSNSKTDSNKDYMIKYSIGLTYTIPPKIKNDSDKDGIPNKTDKCPNTPIGEKVNQDGCPILDDDSDGILNSEDKCPNTPLGEKVNGWGCSNSQLDDDSDGIYNNKDLCPKTPKGEQIDKFGCSNSQLDNDRDGIMNNLDNCPDEKGTSSNAGCPISTAQMESQVQVIANEVHFETNKADLVYTSLAKLNELVVILIENPDTKIIVSGHTDDVGTEDSNYLLSEKRAQSVVNYLMEMGIQKTRMTALAFGERQLKMNKISQDARANNRRVEIKIYK